MELAMAGVIGVLFTCGTYLILKPNLIRSGHGFRHLLQRRQPAAHHHGRLHAHQRRTFRRGEQMSTPH